MRRPSARSGSEPSAKAHGDPAIRPARAADLDAIEHLENASFTYDRLSRRSLSRLLAARSARLLVAPAGVGLAGYALVLFRAGSTLARLYSLAVATHAGRRGLGRQLLAAAEADAIARGCRALRLEVRADNERAIRLYVSCGYAPVHHMAGYYADGASALRLERQL